MTRFLLAFPLVAAVHGCSADPATPDPGGGRPGSGGSATQGGKGGASGATAGTGTGKAGTGGTGGGSAGSTAQAGKGGASAGASGSSGTSGTGGTGGTAGSVGTGGFAGKGTGGGASGSAGTGGSAFGGAGNGGTGGSSGGAGGGTAGTGGKSGGMGSMGCGKGGRPQGGVVMMQNQYIFTFPESYDGTTPFPLVFGFHGAGNSNTSFRTTDADTEGTEFEQNYVMAYIKSMGNDWTGQLQANIGLFDDMLELLEGTYCIDTTRIFAMGHSSGAQFISNLVCRPEPRLTAVGLVASSPYNGNCRAIPAMIIHGKMDRERGNDGSMYVADYREQNGCSSTTAPFQVASCSSKNGGATVAPGCVEYQDCGENDLIWCSHDDPHYSGTNHGWPCFANGALFDFFSGY